MLWFSWGLHNGFGVRFAFLLCADVRLTHSLEWVITCPLTSAGCIFCGAQWKMKRWVFLFKKQKRNFPGGSVVKSLCFHCGRYGFDLWSGNWDPAYCKVQPENRKKEKGFSLLFLWSLSWLVMVFLFADWCFTPSCLRTPEAWVWPSPTTQQVAPVWHELAWHQPFLLHTQAPTCGSWGVWRTRGSWQLWSS